MGSGVGGGVFSRLYVVVSSLSFIVPRQTLQSLSVTVNLLNPATLAFTVIVFVGVYMRVCFLKRTVSGGFVSSQHCCPFPVSVLLFMLHNSWLCSCVLVV